MIHALAPQVPLIDIHPGEHVERHFLGMTFNMTRSGRR